MKNLGAQHFNYKFSGKNTSDGLPQKEHLLYQGPGRKYYHVSFRSDTKSTT